MSLSERRIGIPPSLVKAPDLENLLAQAAVECDPHVDQLILKAAANLKRATTVLEQTEVRQLHGITGRTSAAFRVLVMIWTFGPIEAKDVARLSGVSRQAVSGVLATLERDELVSRERATKTDKRLAPITITAAGAELVEQNLALQNKVQKGFFNSLSLEELKTLIDLLSRLIVASHD